jgi:hypothetical protein
MFSKIPPLNYTLEIPLKDSLLYIVENISTFGFILMQK